MEVRVKITHLIVVGANCLSSSLIKSLNDEGASCKVLLLKIVKKTGSMKTMCMEVRVKNTHLIVVGANCLSSSLINSFE